MSAMPAVSAQNPLQPGASACPTDYARPIEAQAPCMPVPAPVSGQQMITSHPSAGPLPPPMSLGDGGSLSAARGGQCSAPPNQHGVIIPVRPEPSASGAAFPIDQS